MNETDLVNRYKGDDQTLSRIIPDLAQRFGERPYLRFRDHVYTYRAFDEMCARVAGGLQQLGAKQGSTIAVMLPNCPEMLFAWLGASRMGAIHVPLNTALKGDALAYVINDCEATILIIDEQFMPQLEPVLHGLSHLRTIVVRGTLTDPRRKGPARFSFDDVASSEPIEPSGAVRPGDPCVIQYTSGTTGPPKGAVLPHAYWWWHAAHLADVMQLTEADVAMGMMPLFHVGCTICAVLSAYYVGAQLVLAERYSATRFWTDVRRHGVTYFHFVGLVLGTLLAQPRRPDDADNPALRAFGIPVPKDVHTEFESRFGLKLVTAMGTTEVGNITITDLARRLPGSVGRPVPGWEVAIVDDADETLPAGAVGEFVARPQRPFIMSSGYHNRAEETLSTWRNLWFHTGDLGYRSEDGEYYFVDRKKDAIRYRGEMVSAYQVEQAVCLHPAVLECAAIPIPDPINEEEIKVCVVLKPGGEATYESLVSHCEEHLPSFAVPRYLEFKEQLPKTPSEKIEKYKLRAEGLTETTWDRKGDAHGAVAASSSSGRREIHGRSI